MRTAIPLAVFLLAPLAGQDARTVRGVVVDENDRPLADVAVCPFDDTSPFSTAELVAHPATRTREDGTFTLQWKLGQRPPLNTLLFVAEGRVHVAVGAYYVDMLPVVLPPGRTLAGTVRDRAGRPLAGVRVEARDWLTQGGLFGAGADTMSTAPEPRTAVRTDAAGRFVLQGTCEQAIQVQVGGDGFALATRGPLAAGQSWDATIAPAPVVTVQVVDAAGDPVPGVALRATSATGSESRQGYSNPDGRWRLTWLGDGAMRVTGSDELHRPIGEVEIPRGTGLVSMPTRIPAPARAIEEAPPPGTVLVTGRVVDGEAPVTGATVGAVDPTSATRVDFFVLSNGATSAPGSVRTAADGTFRLHLEPGSHCLVASSPDWRGPNRYRNPSPVPVEVRPDMAVPPVELRMQPLVAITGKVEPAGLARGCMLWFMPVSEYRWSGEEWDFEQRVPIAGDGTFVAGGLMARRHRVALLLPRAFRQGLPDKVPLAEIDVAPGAEFRLSFGKVRPRIVRGTVQSPVPYTRLAIMSLAPNDPQQTLYGCRHHLGPVTAVERDGSYRLTEPPGVRALVVVDLATGVVLHRADEVRVGDADRTQDLEVSALRLDVSARGLREGTQPWLDIVVSAQHWPAGLGQMVELGDDRTECGVGIALDPGQKEPTRLWLPGRARLVLRSLHGVFQDGREVLDDVTVDPAEEQLVRLQGGK